MYTGLLLVCLAGLMSSRSEIFPMREKSKLARPKLGGMFSVWC